MNISMEVLTRDEAARVATLDSDVSCNPAQYVRNNILAYYVAINTLYYQIESVDKWCALSVLEYIKRNGLLPTIKELDSDSLALVQGQECSSQIGQLIDASVTGHMGTYYALDGGKNFFRDHLATKLQLMRYLKRFSPSNADKIQDASYSSFLANENRTKLLQRKEYPTWLTSAIAEEISEVVDWDQVVREIDNISLYDFKVPSGSVFEGNLTFGQKIDKLSSSHPEWFKAPFGLPYVWPSYSEDSDIGACRVQAVPKSYKAARIIAMEPLSRQSKAGIVADILARHLPSNLDIRDQGRNQQLAQQGSLGRMPLATLDASNASDLISKTLWRQVFPYEFVRRVDELLSKYTICKGVKRPMQMMSTSGHALTFILETLVYYGIAAAAVHCVLGAGVCVPFIISVYGDDVILPSAAAVTATQFYAMVGLKINESKSYWDGPYRESCGEEYYNGINISSTYFPRFPVVGVASKSKIDFGVRMYRDTYRGKIDDCTTMLVDLQKRLFGVSQSASMFLWQVIKAARPRITSSKYGTVCNDCWAATSIGIHVNPAKRMNDREGINIPSIVVDSCATEKHSYASLQYKLPLPFGEDYYCSRAFEIYKYQMFLKTGPTYASKLDELLGVSERPMSVSSAYGTGRLVWRYSIE
jgi:hypothetical protein